MRFALGIVFAVLALPALAADPMTGAEFEAYTAGKTLLYSSEGGEPYGGEEYLPGHKVRWSLLDGHCVDGSWYEDGPAICFTYDDGTDPSCWVFYTRPRGLEAHLQGDTQHLLYSTGEAAEPLFCLGPEVGV